VWDEDAEQWEGQFEDWEDCGAAVPGVDCAAGWWQGRSAAGRVNDALAECGFEIWEIEAHGAMQADGGGVVRLVGSPLAVRRLARLLALAARQAPPDSSDGARGAA
jgi:hypothetical protein